MKNIFYSLLAATIIFALACKKTTFITSPEASVAFSADTLHFDTVFTTTGSITQAFKIFNLNDQKLKLNNVQLMGGNSSAFKMNVDGTPGTSFSDIELLPNDSIYVFVSLTINPSAPDLAFIVQDSIMVSFNGNSNFIQLDAYGQNAHFLRGDSITTNRTWLNDKPYVILDSLTIKPGAKLMIDSGCRIYSHANAPFVVQGSLQVNGDSLSRVTFAGDRLDPDYKDLPGSWPGIFFANTSTDNVLNYTVIKNAYQGIMTDFGTNNKIILNQCIINNIFDAGIVAYNSSIRATNCLISNCGRNISITAGGDYKFDFCTVVSYGNFYVQHKSPVLYITDADELNVPHDITALFRNCIFYGEGGIAEDEVVVSKKGTTTFNVTFESCLYKNKTANADTYFDSISVGLKNLKPQFEEIEISKKIFNFRLQDISPAVDAGTPITSVTVDLDGKPRPVPTLGAYDIGCYERQ